MELCFSQLFPRQSGGHSQGAVQTRQPRINVGKYRAGVIRDGVVRHVPLQLALYSFLLSAVFLPRTLLQLFERLLSPLRCQSRQTDCVGGEQLREDLQLALLLQRLSRGTSFPPQSAL